MQRTKILLIVGSLRSGSTILGNVLGQIDGFLSVGELADVWVNVWHNQGMCGCGDKATSCELWRPIFEQSLGDPDDVPGYAMYHEGRKALRTGSLPLMAMPLTRKQLLSHIGDYLSVTRALHRAIAEQTAARVIVDHSKYPAYRYVLEALDQFDLYVLHLVRDPRGVVYSWLRRKAHRGGPKGHMYENPLLTSVKWLVWNGAAEFFSHAKPERYLRVRYEDFVRAPRSMIERVCEFIGEGTLEVPFFEGLSAVDLDVTHTVAGNPNRFVTGRVDLRVDQQWVRFMPRKFRLLTLAVTFPLLHRYGYRYRDAFRSAEREGAIQTRGARLVELARSTGVPRDRITRGRRTGTYHAGRGSDKVGETAENVTSLGRGDRTRWLMEPATETIRIDDNVEAVAKEWEGLADDLRVPPFLRPGWMTAWLQTFGASPPRIYSAWREGQLIGLVPLLARRWRFVSPTNAHTPLFGVVANDARTTRALTRAVLDAEPQRVTFGYLDQHAPSSVVLGDVLRERGFHTLSQTRIRSPYSEVDGDWAVFEARFKKNRRSELRRRRRRLEERGKVTFDMEDGAGDLDRLLAEGYEVEASGWKGERGTAIQSTPATTNFYSNVARWAVSCGWLRLAFLRVGNRPIAFQYMLRYDDSVYYLKGGYEETYRKWSPGILLSYEVLRHSFFDGEIRSFEWLGADDAYKTEWSDGERTRLRLDAFAPTPLGRARLASTLAWRATEARGRQLARSRMPPALRDRAQTVYGRIDNLRRR